jgi:hypothetical protein
VGAVRTAVYAVVAALLLPRALALVSASRRGLVLKLVLSWLAIQGIFVAFDVGAIAVNVLTVNP